MGTSKLFLDIWGLVRDSSQVVFQRTDQRENELSLHYRILYRYHGCDGVSYREECSMRKELGPTEEIWRHSSQQRNRVPLIGNSSRTWFREYFRVGKVSTYQRIVRVIVRRTRTRIRRTVYAKCVVLVPVTYGSVLPTMLHDVRVSPEAWCLRFQSKNSVSMDGARDEELCTIRLSSCTWQT